MKKNKKSRIPKQIETARLVMKRLSPGDSSFVFELVNTEGWLRFIGDRGVSSKKDAAGYIKQILAQDNIRYWVVRRSADQLPMGIITLIKRDYLDYPDIGFAFLPQFSGKGYAYEATKAVLEQVNETAREEVLSITRPDNVNSIRLLKKLGFEFLSEIEVDNETLQVYHSRSKKNQN